MGQRAFDTLNSGFIHDSYPLCPQPRPAVHHRSDCIQHGSKGSPVPTCNHRPETPTLHFLLLLPHPRRQKLRHWQQEAFGSDRTLFLSLLPFVLMYCSWGMNLGSPVTLEISGPAVSCSKVSGGHLWRRMFVGMLMHVRFATRRRLLVILQLAFCTPYLFLFNHGPTFL